MKGSLKTVDHLQGIETIAEAQEEVTSYPKRSWKKLRREVCPDVKWRGEDRTATGRYRATSAASLPSRGGGRDRLPANGKMGMKTELAHPMSRHILLACAVGRRRGKTERSYMQQIVWNTKKNSDEAYLWCRTLQSLLEGIKKQAFLPECICVHIHTQYYMHAYIHTP